MLTRALPILLLLALAACGGGGGEPVDDDPVAPPTCRNWEAFLSVGTIVPDPTTGALKEISGLAVGLGNPAILWAHDDSGAGAALYALQENGFLRQTYTLDTPAYDWEDIAIGPGPEASRAYLYVGDIGDNGRRREHVTLLRVAEPAVPETPGPPVALPHAAFHLVYPDGAHDAEALLIDAATQTLYVLTKAEEGGDVYRTPGPLDAAWTAAAPGTFVKVTTGLTLPPNVTAADADPSGERVVFRTYTSGYELVRRLGDPFETLFDAAPCPFVVPFLGQYESLAITPDGRTLYATTELVIGSTVPLLRADVTP